jgi:hypothetical protein
MLKHIRARYSLRAAAVILAGFLFEFVFLPSFASAAGPDASGRAKPATSDVILTTPAAARVTPATPPLHLSDVQRKRIAEVVKGRDTDIEFKLKKAKSAKSFEPKIDEKLPSGLKGQAFPQPLLAEIPAVRQYTYLKLRGQVLIVNPMSHKIVDMFPEQSG